MYGRSEIQRRQRYMNHLDVLFGRTYPDLFSLVSQCLHNSPRRRPSSGNLLARLDDVRREVDELHGGAVMRPLSVGKVLMDLQIKRKVIELEKLKVRSFD